VTGQKTPTDTPTTGPGTEEAGPAAAQAIDRPIPQGTSVEVPEGQGKTPAQNEPDLVKRLGPLVPAKIKKVLDDPLATGAEKQAAKKQLQKVADDLEKRNQGASFRTGTGLGRRPQGFIRFKSSDGATHDIPANQLDKAREIDPALEILEQD
jgi:hypothetical protein